MSIPRPTIVIFDMDGTVVRHVNPRLLHILEWLDDASFKVVKTFDWIFKKKAKGDLVPAYYRPPSKRSPKILVHRALHKFRRKPVEQIVEPRPGIIQVLQILQKNNIPLAIVSNGLGKGYGDDILSKFDLEKYFGAKIFREDIGKSKPNPEPILLGLERLGVTPSKDDIIWYVGDRHKDVTAALNANKQSKGKIVPIAVAFNAAVAILENMQPAEHIIMSYYDMLERLSDMFKTEPPPAPDTSPEIKEGVIDLNDY